MRHLVVGVVFLLFAGRAYAGTAVYSYTQDNGTLAFSDEYERVPARYRAHSDRHSNESLIDYPRHTLVQRYPELRSQNPEGVGEVRAPGVTIHAQQPTMMVDAGQGLLVPVAVGEEAGKVEVSYSYRWSNGRYTPFTVVRQGDRVLAEIERPSGAN